MLQELLEQVAKAGQSASAIRVAGDVANPGGPAPRPASSAPALLSPGPSISRPFCAPPMPDPACLLRPGPSFCPPAAPATSCAGDLKKHRRHRVPPGLTSTVSLM